MPQPAGAFDAEMRLESAYDPESLVIEGWFDPEIIPGTLPISASSGLRFEALVGLAPTAVEQVDAEAGAGIVSQTSAFAWEAEQTVAKTNQGPDDENQGIASTVGEVWEAIKTIAFQTTTGAYEALKGLGPTAPSPEESVTHPADAVCSFRGNGGLVRQDVGGLSIQPASPATLQDGDLVFLLLAFSGSITSLVVPAGFALVKQQGNDYIYAKIADREPGSYFVSWTTSRNASAVSFAYSGTDGIEDIVVTSDPGLAVNHTTGTLNVQRSNEGLLIIARSFDTNLNQDPAAGFVERFDYGNTAGQFLAWELQDKLAASGAGTKGTFTYQGAAGFTSTNRTYLISILAHRGATAKTGLDVGGGLTPTTARSTLSYEAEAGVAKTGGEPEESNKAIRATGGEPFETTDHSVVQDAFVRYEALAGVAKTGGEPVETTPTVTGQTASEPVEWNEGIAAEESGPVEAANNPGGTTSEPWESTRDVIVVQQTADIPVEADAAVASSRSDPVEATSPTVLATESGPWEAQKGVASTKSYPWETEGVVVSVSQLGRLAIDSTQKVKGLTSGMRWEAYAALVKQTARAVVDALKGVSKTGSDPWESGFPAVATVVSLRVEANQGVRATDQETYEALHGVFQVAPDPHDNPGEAFNYGGAVVESTVTVRAVESGAYEAAQKLAATIAARIDAAGAVRGLHGMPVESLAPGVAASASAPFEVTVGLRPFVAVPLEAPGGVVAVAVLPVDARGHIVAKGFAVGVVLAGSEAESAVVAGSEASSGTVAGSKTRSSIVAAAMTAARVIAATISNIEDEEGGET